MHNHSNKGSKLQRERDQRNALIKNLATSLITDEQITTTTPKAKTVTPYVEKLITHAKKGTLASRRIVISKLDTIEAAHKLCDEIAPATKARTSGYLRIESAPRRSGDHAAMSTVSFVDSLSQKGKE